MFARYFLPNGAVLKCVIIKILSIIHVLAYIGFHFFLAFTYSCIKNNHLTLKQERKYSTLVRNRFGLKTSYRWYAGGYTSPVAHDPCRREANSICLDKTFQSLWIQGGRLYHPRGSKYNHIRLVTARNTLYLKHKEQNNGCLTLVIFIVTEPKAAMVSGGM